MSGPSDLDVLTRSVLATVFDAELFDAAYGVHDLEAPCGARFRSIVSTCSFDRSARLVVMLPDAGRTILLTITEGEPGLVRDVLASLGLHAQDACSCVGTVWELDEPQLAAQAIHGAALLTANTFNALEALPDTIDAGGSSYRMLGVCFLSQDDIAVWKQQGFDGLMDHFAAVKKDLICFGSQPGPS